MGAIEQRIPKVLNVVNDEPIKMTHCKKHKKIKKLLGCTTTNPFMKQGNLFYLFVTLRDHEPQHFMLCSWYFRKPLEK
jgi:hypothetical protein